MCSFQSTTEVPELIGVKLGHRLGIGKTFRTHIDHLNGKCIENAFSSVLYKHFFVNFNEL